MNSLTELRRRKAEVKAKMALQRSELKATMLEIRTEIEPANLLKKAVGGFFGAAKPKENTPESAVLGRIPPFITFLTDLLVKDPKIAMLVKLLAPMAIKFFPTLVAGKSAKNDAAVEGELPKKSNVYGSLRRSVTTLRKRLQKKDASNGNLTPTAEAPVALEPLEN